MAYEYIDGGWAIGFEACLCPDIEKLHEMVENKTKEKGKLKKIAQASQMFNLNIEVHT